jgi:hypothetical protein
MFVVREVNEAEVERIWHTGNDPYPRDRIRRQRLVHNSPFEGKIEGYRRLSEEGADMIRIIEEIEREVREEEIERRRTEAGVDPDAEASAEAERRKRKEPRLASEFADSSSDEEI